MTGPFFSVGPCQSLALNVSGTISQWIALLQTALLSSNWTTYSTFVGSGGTLGINMQTFPTPNSQTAILKVWWDGTTTPFNGDAVISFEFFDSSYLNGQIIGVVSIKDTKDFTLILGPHQFFLFSTQSGAFEYNYVMGGVPVTLGNGNTYWGIGDEANGGAPSFTNTLAGVTGSGNWAYLLNGTAVSRTTIGMNLPLQLMVNRSHTFANDPVSFSDGTVPVIEAILLMLENTAVYLWDAVVASTSFTENLVFNFLGQTFNIITLNYALGALAVVATSGRLPGALGGYSY